MSTTLPYPSDVTDEQWCLLRPYLDRRRRRVGHPRTVSRRCGDARSTAARNVGAAGHAIPCTAASNCTSRDAPRPDAAPVANTRNQKDF